MREHTTSQVAMASLDIVGFIVSRELVVGKTLCPSLRADGSCTCERCWLVSWERNDSVKGHQESMPLPIKMTTLFGDTTGLLSFEDYVRRLDCWSVMLLAIVTRIVKALVTGDGKIT